MAITFVAAGTPGGRVGFPGPTYPAGLATGDIIIASALGGEAQLVSTYGYTAMGGGFEYWIRYAGQAVPTVFNDSVRLVAYRGCLPTGNPIGGQAAQGVGLTTTAANSWALFLAEHYTSAGSLTETTPSSGPALVLDSVANNQNQGDLRYGFISLHGLIASPTTIAGETSIPSSNIGGHGNLFELLADNTALPPPAPTSVAPTSGPAAGGTAVVISGSAFVAGAGVTFGGTSASVGTITSTAVSATSPAHAAGVVSIVVTNPDAQAGTLASAFTYVAPPDPTSLSLTSGTTTGGSSVTVNGTGFQAGATVTFGGTGATVGTITTTTIAVTTPAHASGLVNVVVTNTDAQAGTLVSAFTYVPPPNPTSLAPTSGLITGGTVVVIDGTGFLPGAGVTFDGISASVGTVASTSVSATSPAHVAGAVDVAVTNTDAQFGTLAAAFTYVEPPPVIMSLAPTTGSNLGGDVVVLSGSGFLAGAGVTFDGVSASVGAITPTTVTTTAPAHPATGSVDVTVTNLDVQFSTLALGFFYIVPSPPEVGTGVALIGTH